MPILILIVAIFIFFIVISLRSDHGSYSKDEEPKNSTKYSLSAPVSEDFHDMVEDYARKHNTTMAAVIRSAVTEYINNSTTE